MARKRTLLTRLADTGAPATPDTPTPPAGAPPPDSKLETPPAAAPKLTSAVVTDPHAVWSALIRTPQGQRLTDPRIQQLSPQRFDTVFLAALKSAFLAGWDASKGVEE